MKYLVLLVCVPVLGKGEPDSPVAALGQETVLTGSDCHNVAERLSEGEERDAAQLKRTPIKSASHVCSYFPAMSCSVRSRRTMKFASSRRASFACVAIWRSVTANHPPGGPRPMPPDRNDGTEVVLGIAH